MSIEIKSSGMEGAAGDQILFDGGAESCGIRTGSQRGQAGLEQKDKIRGVMTGAGSIESAVHTLVIGGHAVPVSNGLQAL